MNLSQSHPMWVRGLKLLDMDTPFSAQYVAPHVGAWIETPKKMNIIELKKVAPHVGAWIETII